MWIRQQAESLIIYMSSPYVDSDISINGKLFHNGFTVSRK